MRKSVNVILIVQTILFYSSFFIDFEILFPTHWATLVSLIINPILSLIGLIPAIWFKRWLATLGLILYFLSFPIGMIAGYALQAFSNGWDITITSQSLYILLGLWLVTIIIAIMALISFQKNRNKLDLVTFWMIYLPPLLTLVILSIVFARQF